MTLGDGPEYTGLSYEESISRLESLRQLGHEIVIRFNGDRADFVFEPKRRGRSLGVFLIGCVERDEHGAFIDAHPRPKVAAIVVFVALFSVFVWAGPVWPAIITFPILYGVLFTIEATMVFRVIRRLYARTA